MTCFLHYVIFFFLFIVLFFVFLSKYLILGLEVSWLPTEVIVLSYLVTHCVHESIDSNNLIKFVDSQPSKHIYSFEVEIASGHSPSNYRESTEYLYAKLFEGVFRCCNDTILITKYSDVEDTKESAYSMNLNCLNRIINSVSFKNLCWTEIN